MRHRFFSSSWSKWARLLPAFVFVAAMIAVSGVLLRRDTWRRDTPRQDTHTDAAPVPAPPTDEMTQTTECFSAVGGKGSDKRLLPLRREPLARWTDPTGDLTEAALWAWGERGRPYALVAIEHYVHPGRDTDAESWGFELISLANEPLEVEGTNEVRAMNATSDAHSKPVLSGAIHWTPKPPGLTFCDVPDAPPPAQTAQTRLLQMKDLIKRFSAVIHPGPGQSELQLIPDAINRYSDAEAGQVDGAIFVFAIGTNPEVIVLLEAQESTPGKASWRYAVAQATAASFKVAIDGKEVLAAPYHSDQANTPGASYFCVGMPPLKP